MKGFKHLHETALSSGLHVEKNATERLQPHAAPSGSREHGAPRYFDDYGGQAVGKIHDHAPSLFTTVGPNSAAPVPNRWADRASGQHGMILDGAGLTDERHPMYLGLQSDHEALHAPERLPAERERKRQESLFISD